MRFILYNNYEQNDYSTRIMDIFVRIMRFLIHHFIQCIYQNIIQYNTIIKIKRQYDIKMED